jgi:metal-dependent HD superfamily phosphatase/phosphodiesterase
MKVESQFDWLCSLQDIQNMYVLADKISNRQLKNKHDWVHALSVCNYALTYHSILYPKIVNCAEVARAMDQEWQSLFVVLTGALCHDLGRSYSRQQPDMGYSRVMESVDYGVKVNFAIPDRQAAMNAIQECIKYHDESDSSPFFEAGVVMIADATDNSRARLFPRTNTEEFKNDKSPIDYYGCLETESVRLSSANCGAEIELSITGFAGAYVFQQIKRKIQASGLKNFIKIVINLNNGKNTERIEVAP